jgi:hypothetical protein
MSFEKGNITLTMKEAIKVGNEKIKQRKKLSNAKSMVLVMEQPSSTIANEFVTPAHATSSSAAAAAAAIIEHIHKNSTEEQQQQQQQQQQRCNGEKKKGGRCSRKAKKDGFCETHSTDRKEMERKLEGGIYVFRCKSDLYDIEEIRRRGMV